MARRGYLGWAGLLLALTMLAPASHAQLRNLMAGAGPKPSANEPVTFTADQVEYDREKSLVVARGHVEAWQNDHVLRADEIVFDRNTGVATANGHVVLMEPDGQTLFADHAEMTRDMQDAVLKDMRALLAENGRLAANGARRTSGEINEMTRVVYTTCNLCADDPNKPPLWQIRARSAVQDLEHKRVEYYDAELQMFGIPVAYTPYLAHPDPSVKRQSGFLVPGAGISSQLGTFVSVPYYWVIDGQSDALVTPMMTTRHGPQADVLYRQRFNDGYLMVNTSGGYIDNAVQGSLVARGQFAWNDTWRWGFDINRASSADYIRAYHVGNGLVGDPNLLASNVYVEGFGQGAYARLDTKFYQGLANSVANTRLPTVLPRYQYSYFGTPDALGGRTSLDFGAFNLWRSDGTNTRRGNLALNWERPFTGPLGDLWQVTLHGDAITYDANRLNEQPNFSFRNHADAARGLPQISIKARWPFMRDSGSWGIQVVEPIVEFVGAPQSGDSQIFRYPNEDSLDFEFSDANLFGFNRFSGVDRLEGGMRANAALHGAWYLGGTLFDGLIGQSYRTNKDLLFPQESGLRDQVSDIVARGTLVPTSWMDLTYRTRLDKNSGSVRMAEAVAQFGGPKLTVGTGYLYTADNPYTYYDLARPPAPGSAYFQPRNEVSLNVSSRWNEYRFSGYARRDIENDRMVIFGGDLVYENECFIFDLRFYRRYTSFNNDNGSSTVVFLITFKTIGQFGYRAL